MTNVRSGTAKDSVTVGNRDKMISKHMGDIKGMITTKYGQEVAKVWLKDVAYTPKSKFNLLSLTKMMSEGWNMIGNNKKLTINKNNVTIEFDIIIKTQRGQLFCVNLQRNEELSMAVMDISKDKAHRILGHANEETTIKSAKHLGWNSTGSMHKCNSCYVAKAKQKAVPKVSAHESADKPGIRFYLDLSKIKKLDNIKTIGKSN